MCLVLFCCVCGKQWTNPYQTTVSIHPPQKKPNPKIIAPYCLTELTSSVVKTESDSSEEKSDHLYEMVEGDSEGSSNGSIKLDEDFDNNLPETVSVLKHPNGAKVYLVGTAHFSKESQEDVSFVRKKKERKKCTMARRFRVVYYSVQEIIDFFLNCNISIFKRLRFK